MSAGEPTARRAASAGNARRRGSRLRQPTGDLRGAEAPRSDPAGRMQMSAQRQTAGGELMAIDNRCLSESQRRELQALLDKDDGLTEWEVSFIEDISHQNYPL